MNSNTEEIWINDETFAEFMVSHSWECQNTLYEHIQKNPSNPLYYIRLAELLKFLRKEKSAVKAYRKVNELNPDSLTLTSKISWIGLQNGHKPSEKTLTCYNNVLNYQKTAVFFSPDIGVLPHFSAQCVVAKTLQEQGIQVLFLDCSDLYYPFIIPSVDVIKSWFSPQNIEHYKYQNYKILNTYLKSYGLVNIRPKVPTDTLQLDSDIEEFSSQRKNLLGYEYDGVAFGKLALLDLALLTKRISFNEVSDDLLWLWSVFVKNNVLAYKLLKFVYSNLKIDYAFHYNDYSLMLTHRIVSQLFPKTSLFSISHSSHLGIDRRHYNIYSKTFRETAIKQGNLWTDVRDIPLTKKMVGQVGDDLISRLSGMTVHVYSSAKTTSQEHLRRKINLDGSKQLIVAYTSSLDEFMAAKMGMEECLKIKIPDRIDPFQDQIDWLQHLVAFAESCKNIKLLVRVHPRESKNKRDSTVSEHFQLLLNSFSKTFHNTYFIWPEDPVSSYDLAEIADLVLTSWSTVGLECARLGIPVLTAMHGISPFPHDDFLEWSETPISYFDKLQALIDRPAAISTIARSFRCYHLYQLGSAIDFGDVIPSKDFSYLPKFSLGKEAASLHAVVTGGKDMLEVNYNRLKTVQSGDSSALEKQAIIQQLRRIFHFIFTGQDDFPPNGTEVKLQYIPQASSLEDLVNCAAKQVISFEDRAIAFVGQQGKQVFYIAPSGQALHRYSPLCARLVPLISQAV